MLKSREKEVRPGYAEELLIIEVEKCALESWITKPKDVNDNFACILIVRV